MLILGSLFVISAPSGTGKTTVVNQVLKELQPLYDIRRVITYTTRAIRDGEVDGVDYIFITQEKFKEKIDSDYFLEWSCGYGDYYGSPRSIIDSLAQGVSWISILDQNGAHAVKQVYPDVVLIWLLPPSLEELERRLHVRGSNSEKQIQKRLVKAVEEINEEEKENFYKYCVVNDDFDETVKKIINCILGQIAEK